MSVEAWLSLAAIGVTICLALLGAIFAGVGWMLSQIWRLNHRLTRLESRLPSHYKLPSTEDTA